MVDIEMDRSVRLEEYRKEGERLSAVLDGINKQDVDTSYTSCLLTQEALNISGKLENPCWLQEEDVPDDDIDEALLENENSWLFKDDASVTEGSVELIDDDVVEVNVTPIIKQMSDLHERYTDRKHRLKLLPKNTNTYVRKRGSSLTPVKPASPAAVLASPKTRRRLTTTIEPSPALIPHLEQLSRTNNRALSKGEDLRWEDGAPDVEATPVVQPAASRQNVPESLIKRLEELKASNLSICRANNSINTPKFRPGPMHARDDAPLRQVSGGINPMTVSQLMGNIPDWENEEHESLLSLGDTSLLHIGDKLSEMDLAHLNNLISENGARMTMGGVIIPPNRVALEQFVELDKSLTDERRLTLAGAFLPSNVGEPDLISLRNVAEETFVQLETPDNPFSTDGYADENCNTDRNANGFKEYSSKLFDATFPKNTDDFNQFDSTFNQINGVMTEKGDAAVPTEPIMNGTFTNKTAPVLNNTFAKDQHNLTFTPPGTQIVAGKAADETFTPPESQTILGKSYVKTVDVTYANNEVIMHVEEKNSNLAVKNYSTATYTRPTTRMSPVKSGLPRRRGVSSTEDLARSPARSDGSITPVENKPALGTYTRNSPVTVMGTYTRNSPVERCGSEDERMSTASDRSQDSVEDLLERFKSSTVGGKRSASTPRNSGAIVAGPDDWQMSPISRHQSLSAASSSESIGRVQRLPHGLAAFKPALIRPTDNFKRPILKKVETTSGKPTPLRPMPAPTPSKPATGLTQPISKVPSSRIPSSRLSAIPRPGAARPSIAKKS